MRAMLVWFEILKNMKSRFLKCHTQIILGVPIGNVCVKFSYRAWKYVIKTTFGVQGAFCNNKLMEIFKQKKQQLSFTYCIQIGKDLCTFKGTVNFGTRLQKHKGLPCPWYTFSVADSDYENTTNKCNTFKML